MTANDYLKNLIHTSRLPIRAANVLRNMRPPICSEDDFLALTTHQIMEQPNAGRITARQIDILQGKIRKKQQQPAKDYVPFMEQFEKISEKLENITQLLVAIHQKQ